MKEIKIASQPASRPSHARYVDVTPQTVHGNEQMNVKIDRGQGDEPLSQAAWFESPLAVKRGIQPVICLF